MCARQLAANVTIGARITGRPMHEEDEKGCGKTMVVLFLKSVRNLNRCCGIPCWGVLVSITPIASIGHELLSDSTDPGVEDELWRRVRASVRYFFAALLHTVDDLEQSSTTTSCCL